MTTSAPELPHTYDWARATGGRLTGAERRAIRAAILAGYGSFARGVATWPLRRRPRSPGLPPAPDSRLARVAEEAAAEQGPVLAGHGYRTWLLGGALSAVDGVPVEPELFYATALLHDSGLVREVTGEDFTVRSGGNLVEVGARAGCDEAVGRAMADAAVAHATPGLPVGVDPVGYYVQAGAMADLAGLRMWDLPRGLLRQAYRAHPGLGVHGRVSSLIRREAAQVPQGRFAMLRRAGVDLMVFASPTRLYG